MRIRVAKPIKSIIKPYLETKGYQMVDDVAAELYIFENAEKGHVIEIVNNFGCELRMRFKMKDETHREVKLVELKHLNHNFDIDFNDYYESQEQLNEKLRGFIRVLEEYILNFMDKLSFYTPKSFSNDLYDNLAIDTEDKARNFAEHYKIPLEYSEDNILVVENILNDIRGTNKYEYIDNFYNNSKEIVNMAAYLGEIIRRQDSIRKWEWQKESYYVNCGEVKFKFDFTPTKLCYNSVANIYLHYVYSPEIPKFLHETVKYYTIPMSSTLEKWTH